MTDGGDEFTDSAMEALRRNLEKNSCHLEVPPGQHIGLEDDSLPAAGTSTRGDPSTGDDGVGVVLERLTWGKHEDFLERYGERGGDTADAARLRGGFDFIVAADVLCKFSPSSCWNGYQCYHKRLVLESVLSVG